MTTVVYRILVVAWLLALTGAIQWHEERITNIEAAAE